MFSAPAVSRGVPLLFHVARIDKLILRYSRLGILFIAFGRDSRAAGCLSRTHAAVEGHYSFFWGSSFKESSLPHPKHWFGED